jgi:hypothetical protein
MEPLQIMYIIFAAVGGFFLMLSIFGGDADAGVELDVGDADFDISDAESPSDAPSVFSIRTLATLLMGFGIAGWVVIRQDGGIGAQLFWGFAVGIFVTVLYFFVMKLMYSMQGSSMTTAASLFGKEGIITIPTTDTGVAQVRVNTSSGLSEYTCKTKDGVKLKQNDSVKITSVPVGMGLIIVEKV